MPSPSLLALTLGGLSLCASLGGGLLLVSASTDVPAERLPVPVVAPITTAELVTAPSPPIVMPAIRVAVPAAEPPPKQVARKPARAKKARKIDVGELDGY
jgi:hypothetical protein